MTSFEMYTDSELAFIYTYKLASYLPSTKDKLISCINERGLKEVDIQQLIEEKVGEEFDSLKHQCPRCKTERRVRDNDIAGSGSYQFVMKRCDICGLDLTKGYSVSRGNIFDKIKALIFSKKNTDKCSH